MSKAKQAQKDAMSKFLDKKKTKQLSVEVKNIAIESIQYDLETDKEYNVRKDYDPEKMTELIESIKIDGVLDPIEIYKDEKIGKYRPLTGHRRFLASKKIGLKEIPSIIRQVDPQRITLNQTIENVLRHDLNPLEEAEAYVKIMNDMDIGQEELAKRLGKTKSTVSETLSVLKLREKVRRAELVKTPKRILTKIATHVNEPYFEKILEEVNKGIKRDELINLIQIEKNAAKKTKSAEAKKEESPRKINLSIKSKKGIVSVEIKHGDDIPDELINAISQEISSMTERTVKAQAAKHGIMLDVKLNMSLSNIDLKPQPLPFEESKKEDSTPTQKPVPAKSEKLIFPGTDSVVTISNNNLIRNKYNFVDYSISKSDITDFILSILPKLKKTILEKTDKDVIIDQWNALPFQKFKGQPEGFFYKACEGPYNLPAEYLRLKEQSQTNQERMPESQEEHVAVQNKRDIYEAIKERLDNGETVDDNAMQTYERAETFLKERGAL